MSFLTIEETEDTLVLLRDMPVTMNIAPDDEDEDEDDDLLSDDKEISIEEIDPIDFDDDDDDDLFDDDL